MYTGWIGNEHQGMNRCIRAGLGMNTKEQTDVYGLSREWTPRYGQMYTGWIGNELQGREKVNAKEWIFMGFKRNGRQGMDIYGLEKE